MGMTQHGSRDQCSPPRLWRSLITHHRGSGTQRWRASKCRVEDERHAASGRSTSLSRAWCFCVRRRTEGRGFGWGGASSGAVAAALVRWCGEQESDNAGQGGSFAAVANNRECLGLLLAAFQWVSCEERQVSTTQAVLSPAFSTFDHIALKVNYPSRCYVQPRSLPIVAATGDLGSFWFQDGMVPGGISHLVLYLVQSHLEIGPSH